MASSNTWELSGTMPTARRWMAHTYSDAAGWTMVGGENGYNGFCQKLQSVYNTKDGVTFDYTAFLPEKGWIHQYSSLDLNSDFVPRIN